MWEEYPREAIEAWKDELFRSLTSMLTPAMLMMSGPLAIRSDEDHSHSDPCLNQAAPLGTVAKTTGAGSGDTGMGTVQEQPPEEIASQSLKTISRSTSYDAPTGVFFQPLMIRDRVMKRWCPRRRH